MATATSHVFSPKISPVEYTAHIEVRYAETDAMGIVHHSVYAIWFEQARTEIFRENGIPFALKAADDPYIYSEENMKYLRQGIAQIESGKGQVHELKESL